MTTKLTAEQMADIKVPQGLEISPDGSKIVVSVGTNARAGSHRQAGLWLFDRDGSSAGRQITFGTANDTAPRWSPDGRSIMFLSDRDRRGTSQLYLLSLADGGEARRITDERSGISSHTWLGGGGDQIAYISPDAPDEAEGKRRKEEGDDAKVWGEFWPFGRMRLKHLASGDTRTIDLGHRHVIGLYPSDDGSKVAVTTSELPDLESMGTTCELAVVDVSTGTADIVCAPGRIYSDITWNRAHTKLYGIAPAGPVPAVSSSQIWGVDATTGATPELVTPGLLGCVRSLARGRDSAEIVAIVQVGVETDLFALEAETGTLTPKRHFEGDLSELSISNEGLVGATCGSTINRPFDVYCISFDQTVSGEPFDRVSDLHSFLDDIEFGPHRVLHWTRGEFELDGILLWPAGKGPDDGPLPTCVSIHGGPYGRWANAFGYARPFAHWLAAQGFLVFLPNARGGSGHGEAFASAVLDSVGKEDWPDILAGIDLIVANGWADPDRMGIGGWSQGGFMTAWAVGHDEEDRQRFKCGVMGAGVSDWGMMVATSDLPTFEQRLGGGNPYTSVGPHEFDRWSPISYVHRATTPLLILHGEQDERVPVSQAVFMHQGLRKQGCETELVVYPREPHGLQERQHVIDLHNRVADWYRERL